MNAAAGSAAFGILAGRARTFRAMADLTADPTVATLPALDWQVDGDYGVVGVASGTDEEIRSAVFAWAEAFGAKLSGEPCLGPKNPGWLVVHLPVPNVGITVGGVLRDTRVLAW